MKRISFAAIVAALYTLVMSIIGRVVYGVVFTYTLRARRFSLYRRLGHGRAVALYLSGSPLAIAGGMGNPNVKPSDRAVASVFINPVSQGVGTVTSGYVSLAAADEILADVICGVLGAAATVDAKLQQAQDAAGTGVKDITGKAITQLVKATDDNKTARINCRGDELDVANAFTHVRLSITVGAAASLVAGMIQSFDGRFQPQAAGAAVKQVVA